jgi:nicotinamide mononucleotide transporter
VNPLEISGFIFGIAGVYLTLKEHIWCFPVGLLNVIISLFLFYEQQLYADALQQIVYILLLSYGWHEWLNGKRDEGLPVTTVSLRLWAGVILTFAGATLVLGYILQEYTNASFPWLDSGASSASFIAQWMIARKKIENWLIWMLVNIVYIGIYINKNLILYALLFGLYFILSIWGYREWRKQLTPEVHAV